MNFREPWYKNPEYWFNKADEYIAAAHRIEKESPYYDEVESFSSLNSVRVIFESNSIEKAGLSEGETRKVILENYPQIPDNFSIFRKLFGKSDIFAEMVSDPKYKEILQNINIGRHEENKIFPSFLMKNKSKGHREVLQHNLALSSANVATYIYIISKEYLSLQEDLRRQGKPENEIKSIFTTVPTLVE